MRSSATSRRSPTIAIERIITTDMSAKIVANLLKQGWTISRVARALDAPVMFVEGVRAKKHVFTLRDIKKLAKLAEQTPQLMLLNSVEARPGVEPLFEATRQMLEHSSRVRDTSGTKSGTKKRRARTKAA